MSEPQVIIPPIKNRFRGFLPVVIDLETSGFDPEKNCILELAAIVLEMDEAGKLVLGPTFHYHIKPFEKAILDPKALEFNKIDPYHPFRLAIDEKEAFLDLFDNINKILKTTKCNKAVMVAHNAWFDQSFINALLERNKITKTPFHKFTSFDTATLAGLAYGQTVLAKALKAANIKFDPKHTHTAKYDTKVTAELFCKIVNEFDAKQSS